MSKKLAKSKIFVSMVGLFTVLSMIGIAGIITPLLAAPSEILDFVTYAEPPADVIPGGTVRLGQIGIEAGGDAHLVSISAEFFETNGFSVDWINKIALTRAPLVGTVAAADSTVLALTPVEPYLFVDSGEASMELVFEVAGDTSISGLMTFQLWADISAAATPGSSVMTQLSAGDIETNFGNLGTLGFSGASSSTVIVGVPTPATSITAEILPTQSITIPQGLPIMLFSGTLKGDDGVDAVTEMSVSVTSADTFDPDTGFDTFEGPLTGTTAIVVTQVPLTEGQGLPDVIYGLVPTTPAFDDVATPVYNMTFDDGASLYGLDIVPQGPALLRYYVYAFISDTAEIGTSFQASITTLTTENVGNIDLPVNTTPVITIEGGGGGGGGGFELIAFGPPNGESVPKFAPVDFFFNNSLNSEVLASLSSYFSISPEIDGGWEVFDEDWGENKTYRVSFMPDDGYETDVVYTIKVAKSVTDSEGSSYTVNLGTFDDASFYQALDEDESYYYFTVVGSDDEHGGFFPPMAWAGYPYDGQRDVSLSVNTASVEFDRDDMDATTFSTDSIYLTKIVDGTPVVVSGTTISPTDGVTRTAFINNFTLEMNSHYRVYITRDVADIRGTSLLGMPDAQNNPGPAYYDFYTGTSSEEESVEYIGTSLEGYSKIEGVYQNVPLFETMFFTYNGPLAVSTVNETNVSISPSLNCDGSDYKAEYDPNVHEIIFVPLCVFQPDTSYTISFADLENAFGSVLDTTTATFLTDGSDNGLPYIQMVRADNYGLMIEFSEPVTSTTVMNKGNYVLKTRSDSTDWASVTSTPLTSATATYDSKAAVGSLQLTLDPGDEFQITLNANITDGAGNALNTMNGANVFTGFIMDATKFAGGTGMQGMSGYNDFDMGMMGESPINVHPMSSFVGTQTKYFVDIPISQQIDAGGRIELVFPKGFNVTSVIPDAGSFMNNDFNGPGTGAPSFASTDPSVATLEGGAADDGVGVIGTRTVVIELSEQSMNQDFLSFDLDMITNAVTAKGPETSGWQVEIVTYNSAGQMLEGLMSMPFFTNAGGDNQINVTINGVLSGDDGTLKVMLDSPATGFMKELVTITGNEGATGNGSVSFENLPDGDYFLFTQPDVSLSGSIYYGFSTPEPIFVGGGEAKNKNISLEPEGQASNRFALDVELIGDFTTDGEGDEVDIFAGSPNGFRRITVTPGDTLGTTYTMYLPDGEWNIGVGPAMSDDFFGPMEMPDWPEPPHQTVRVWNNGTMGDPGSVTMDISSSSNYNISGYVRDGNGVGLANVEVYAYQPQGAFGERHVKTASDGSYSLSVNWAGVYTIGAWKPGLPDSKEKTIEITNGDVSLNIVLQKPGFTISGKVKNYSGVAVPYAPVWTYETDGYGWSGTTTDANGQYILYVDAGSWTIETDPKGVGWLQYSSSVVVTDASVSGINLAPASGVTYYTVSGNITVGGQAKSNTPLRAVKFDANGNYTGLEYGTSTDSEGNYNLNLPGNSMYRIDTWLPEYGEIAAGPDEVPNNPATTSVATSNRTGVNITVGSSDLTEVSIVFNNADDPTYDGVEAFINFDGFDPETGQPTDYHNSKVISDISNALGNHTIKIRNGNYHVFVHVPGYGEYIPLEGFMTSETTPGYIDIGDASADGNEITINLPSLDSLLTLNGSVVDVLDNAVANAWVWIGNPETGFHRGVGTDQTGTFSLLLPPLDNGSYQIGADKPGYMSLQQQTVDMTDEDDNSIVDLEYDLELLAQTTTISGTVYVDQNGGTVNQYDSGESVPYGWVFAVESESGYVSNAPVDGSGYYELGVIDGDWSVYGQSDGYEQSQYSEAGEATSLTVAGSALTEKNIKLAIRENWTKKTKKSSVTPSQGGIIDDTGTGGTGVKVTLPANSLGDSNSAGSVNITNTTAVSRSASNAPFAAEGKVISVVDANGQAITNLNDYIDLELVILKSEVDAEIAAGRTEDYSELLTTSVGYFDNSTNTWVSLETTRQAYYKATAEDTDWSLYISDNANNTGFKDFIYDALINETFTGFADYKLVFKAKTDHLTTFSVTTALAIASVDSGVVAPRSTAGSATLISLPEVIQEVEVDSTMAVELSTTETIVTLNSSGTMQFTLGADAHSLTLSNVDVTGGSVTLLLQSDPLTVDLVEGETRLVDVDGDGIDDLEITLEEILSGNQVKLLITSLSLPGSAEALAEELAEDLEEATTPAEVVTTPVPELYTPAEYMPSKNAKRSLDSEMAALKEYVSIKKVLPATNQEWYVIDFLAYGSTSKVRAIGQRERLGLLKDFMAIYDRLPQNSKDWENMANIAAGTTPSRVLSREAAAIKEFVKVFKRAIDFSQAGDEAFVHQLAYNLRPQTRSLGAERSAIAKFFKVYKKNPNTSYTWAVMRAIAYSGVSEMIEEAKATKEAEQIGSLAPQLPATRNLVIEMDAVNQYVRLTGTTPSGDAWASVHFLAYGSTDESKGKSVAQRFEYLKNFKKKFNKLPTTETGWSEIAEMVK